MLALNSKTFSNNPLLYLLSVIINVLSPVLEEPRVLYGTKTEGSLPSQIIEKQHRYQRCPPRFVASTTPFTLRSILLTEVELTQSSAILTLALTL